MAATNPSSAYRVLVQTLVAVRFIVEWILRAVVVGYFVYLFIFSPEVREAGNFFWPAFWNWLRGLGFLLLLTVVVAGITLVAQIAGPLHWIYKINAFADWLYRGDSPIGSQGSTQKVKLEGLNLGIRSLIILMFSWMVMSWLDNSRLPMLKEVFGQFSNRVWIMIAIGLLTLVIGRTSTGRTQRGWRVFILTALVAIILYYGFQIDILGSSGDFQVTF